MDRAPGVVWVGYILTMLIGLPLSLVAVGVAAMWAGRRSGTRAPTSARP